MNITEKLYQKCIITRTICDKHSLRQYRESYCAVRTAHHYTTHTKPLTCHKYAKKKE